jgi:hypothetical protein
MTRRPVLLALMAVAFCLAGGRMAFSSEVTDLEGKLKALESQMSQEKDKAKKEDLKKQEKQLKEQLKAAEEKEKAAAKSAKEGNKDKAEKSKEGNKDKAEKKAADKVDKNVGKKEEKKTETAKKSEAQGLNKFARFWTEEVGKPMRHFFYGN